MAVEVEFDVKFFLGVGGCVFNSFVFDFFAKEASCNATFVASLCFSCGDKVFVVILDGLMQYPLQCRGSSESHSRLV